MVTQAPSVRKPSRSQSEHASLRGLYARVYVVARNHPRFLAAGLLAKGLWLDLLLYAREYELDGVVPYAAIATCTGTPEEKELAMSALTREGIVELRDEGISILHFLRGNDSKASIERNREKTRKRVAEHRARQSALFSDGPIDRNGVTERASTSLSLSLSLSKGVEEGAGGDEGPPLATRMPPGLPLTPAAREAARVEGVEDVESVWRHFVAHYASSQQTSADWGAKWTGWLSREKRQFGKGPGPASVRRGRAPEVTQTPDESRGPAYEYTVYVPKAEREALAAQAAAGGLAATG